MRLANNFLGKIHSGKPLITIFEIEQSTLDERANHAVAPISIEISYGKNPDLLRSLFKSNYREKL